MATSKTSICNLALSHLGNTKRIANVDTERSAEAELCKVFFDTTLAMVLSDASWPFATKFADLTLVETDPNDEWAFSYTYPADCLFARKILSGVRNDTSDTKVPYKVAQDGGDQLIFTDKENAQLEYTVLVTDASKYPSDFTMALSLLLSAYIAPGITGGDPFKLRQQNLSLYGVHATNARASAFNEEQPDQRPESEFIRGRE